MGLGSVILNHSIKGLSLQGNQIVRAVTGGLSAPYMIHTEAVAITDKLTVSDQDAEGFVAYPFRLSVSPDFVWCELLKRHQSIVPMRIEGDTLIIQCEPDFLPKKYAVVKDAIVLANRDYQEEKKQLFVSLQRDADAETQGAEEADQRLAKIQKDFDALEL